MFKVTYMKYCKMVFILLIISTNAALAQNKSIWSNSLWIKAETKIENLKENASNEIENELKKELNFNPAITFSNNGIAKKTKNIVQNEYSLFVVYKSNSDEENNILSLQKGKQLTTITSKKIESGDEILLNKGNVTKGFILSYFKNDNTFGNKKKGSLILDDLLYTDTTAKNQLMELIYIPRYLSMYEKNLMETYLSIKYGISLLESDYYNSAGDKIWNFKENNKYSSRITGIGKDDSFGLNQKQSGNADNDGLYIAFNTLKQKNSDNKTVLVNNSFILWGDNNKSTLIKEEKNSTEVQKINRVWKVQTTATENTVFENTQLVINKNQMQGIAGKNNDLKYWLVIDEKNTDQLSYSTAKYIQATTNTKDEIIFDNIHWKPNTTALFTIVKAPAFYVNQELLPFVCNNNEGAVQLKIVGGNAPYTVTISNNQMSKEIVTNEDFVTLDHLTSGQYNVKVTDTQNKYLGTCLVDAFANNPINLLPIYYIENNQDLQIKPQVNNEEDITSYEWFLNENSISSDTNITVNKEGNYSVKVLHQNGCVKTVTFEVKNKNNTLGDNWKLYPNPVNFGQSFTIDFHYEKATSTIVTIHDLNGRLLKKHDLGSVKDYTLNDTLLTAGNYLVTVIANGKNETTKLIIK